MNDLILHSEKIIQKINKVLLDEAVEKIARDGIDVGHQEMYRKKPDLPSIPPALMQAHIETLRNLRDSTFRAAEALRDCQGLSVASDETIEIVNYSAFPDLEEVLIGPESSASLRADGQGGLAVTVDGIPVAPGARVYANNELIGVITE